MGLVSSPSICVLVNSHPFESDRQIDYLTEYNQTNKQGGPVTGGGVGGRKGEEWFFTVKVYLVTLSGAGLECK